MHHFRQFSKAAGGQNGDFQTLLDFEKNSSALGSFNCIFENNSLKALFGQNMKKVKILKLSPDSRDLQKLALNFHVQFTNKNVGSLWWSLKTTRHSCV